jgi:nitrous oxide reductase
MLDDGGHDTRSSRRWLGGLALLVAIAAAICVGATRAGTATAAQPAATAGEGGEGEVGVA